MVFTTGMKQSTGIRCPAPHAVPYRTQTRLTMPSLAAPQRAYGIEVG